MTHFGFAFGLITAGVIGGAFVVDHQLKNSPDTTTRTTTTTTVADTSALPPAAPVSAGEAEAATKLADASTSSAIQPRVESAAVVEVPKAAKAPVRAASSRSAPTPSVPEVQPSTPSESVPPTSDAPAPTPAPAPLQPEKSEPQPVPASTPET